MIIFIKIFYGILFILSGVGILKYRKIVKSWTGNFYWAEKYLGTGSTYFVLILIGMGLIFYGVIYPLGGMEFVLGR